MITKGVLTGGKRAPAAAPRDPMHSAPLGLANTRCDRESRVRRDGWGVGIIFWNSPALIGGCAHGKLPEKQRG